MNEEKEILVTQTYIDFYENKIFELKRTIRKYRKIIKGHEGVKKELKNRLVNKDV